jgi:AcrR family transcriptional regulator
VAETAGYSKGAVYSNFKSKDDLFLAILDQLSAERLREFDEDRAASKGAPNRLEEIARRWAHRRMRQGHDWSLLLMEFWTHAARDPQARKAFATRHARLVESIAQRLSQIAAEEGLRFRRPPADLARASSVIGHGMALERLLDPASVGEELVVDMFMPIVGYSVEPEMGKELPVARGRRAKKITVGAEEPL